MRVLSDSSGHNFVAPDALFRICELRRLTFSGIFSPTCSVRLFGSLSLQLPFNIQTPRRLESSGATETSPWRLNSSGAFITPSNTVQTPIPTADRFFGSLHAFAFALDPPSDTIPNIFSTCVQLFGDPSDVFGNISVNCFRFPRRTASFPAQAYQRAFLLSPVASHDAQSVDSQPSLSEPQPSLSEYVQCQLSPDARSELSAAGHGLLGTSRCLPCNDSLYLKNQGHERPSARAAALQSED